MAQSSSGETSRWEVISVWMKAWAVTMPAHLANTCLGTVQEDCNHVCLTAEETGAEGSGEASPSHLRSIHQMAASQTKEPREAFQGYRGPWWVVSHTRKLHVMAAWMQNLHSCKREFPAVSQNLREYNTYTLRTGRTVLHNDGADLHWILAIQTFLNHHTALSACCF